MQEFLKVVGRSSELPSNGRERADMIYTALVRQKRNGATPLRRALTRRRPGGERGAVLVEAALVLPVLLLIVVGIMEFGLLYSSHSTNTASSRSGARLAATEYSQAGQSTAAQQLAATSIAAATAADLKVLNNAEPIGMVIYRVDPNSTNGAPVGGFPGQGMSGGCSQDCIRFQWNPATSTMDFVSGAWTSPNACGLQVDSIGVYVESRHDFITRMIRTDAMVGGHTVMRLEPLPSEQCAGP